MVPSAVVSTMPVVRVMAVGMTASPHGVIAVVVASASKVRPKIGDVMD